MNVIIKFFQGIVMKKAVNSLIKIVYSFIIEIVIKRLAKYASEIKWNLVKDDVASIIREKVPSKLLEDICIVVANEIIDFIEDKWKDITLNAELQNHLVRGNFKKAGDLIKYEMKKDFLN